MATVLSYASITPHHCPAALSFRPNRSSRPNYLPRIDKLRCEAKKSTSNSPSKQDSESENLVLKVAWYSSELLGIAASFFRSPSQAEAPRTAGLELSGRDSSAIDRAMVVETIKEDFESLWWCCPGALTLDAYEEDCEFADPAGSFKGLRRFKRNCTNFGSLIEKSDMKLTKWEDLEDKGIGHWRFSCIMSFPWKPILSATGYTEYYFNAESGKVCRHVENWNVPKMALLKQLLKPSRGFWFTRTDHRLGERIPVFLWSSANHLLAKAVEFYRSRSVSTVVGQPDP
ncbi:hypothetical protein RJ639_014651, partial [Escallonia herrerae]